MYKVDVTMDLDVAESGDMPANDRDEIEVTPEMIGAGLAAISDYERDPVSEIVRDVYLAMEEVRREGGSRCRVP
jgi:hypothetical protein